MDTQIFMDEWAAQLKTLPHWRQALVLSMPGSAEARELAARTILALEAKGLCV